MTGAPPGEDPAPESTPAEAVAERVSAEGQLASSGLRVTEYTDPLCPWAWGSEPVFRALRAALGGQAAWRRVYGILFDTDDDPAPDPAAETRWYEEFVRGISAHTGAPHAARLSRVAATSWPASLVAKAAERQGEPVAERVLRRLRETMFVLGEPADTLEGALAAARGMPGLDAVRLAADAGSPRVLAAVRADHRETRDPLPEVLTVTGPGPHPGTAKETGAGDLRYALPTLVLSGPRGRRVVPGRQSLESCLAAALAVAPGVSPRPQHRSAEELLAYHRSLTGPEWEALGPGLRAPASAVVVATGNGPLWLHPAEAAAYPAPVSGPPSPR
ncbi:Predicted dithiol-disulfide isomerase, DsbA family [Actinacidiphila alni]|uniref:Predicted dithiol-disulfide isomerase, DsbA family n=1 Tax=Actinacidiphila alni TaxID=380248 RepID=A0A1I2BV96_9ACTN|nr:DsbA family protein [Actinacidiphila alni]SFE59987.1 Predicted dithiol-disulfide isomerase, DsbA family [Actinacidiphila alni]